MKQLSKLAWNDIYAQFKLLYCLAWHGSFLYDVYVCYVKLQQKKRFVAMNTRQIHPLGTGKFKKLTISEITLACSYKLHGIKRSIKYVLSPCDLGLNHSNGSNPKYFDFFLYSDMSKSLIFLCCYHWSKCSSFHICSVVSDMKK